MCRSENTVKIADRCKAGLTFGPNIITHFQLPTGKLLRNSLRMLCAEGFKKGMAKNSQAAKDRLEFELQLVITMGFAGCTDCLGLCEIC